MIFRIFLMAVLTLALVTPTPALATIDPQQQLKSTIDGVIDLLRDKEMVTESRREQMRSLVQGRFAFTTMGQWTLGRNWKTAKPAEREQFIKLFSDLLEATYLRRIETYTNETIDYGKTKLKKGKALVATSIQTKTALVPIDYKMLQQKGEWKVYDVVIEGVSLVRNFRNSYGTIIAREGYPGLFTRMEKKISELNQ